MKMLKGNLDTIKNSSNNTVNNRMDLSSKILTESLNTQVTGFYNGKEDFYGKKQSNAVADC